ncbi:MAG TPA: MFS transporter [Amycolatopsis sp.]|uniref:MFS transporter n=1 Tax=Amycolatopsis nalaikhensis TaxID=715472 RepID=A0ABY8XZJ7_9PSEU|nr:MFS transporter [Amycolatopsis sp. 2-2]WIV61034.1 MFS transporter [Amycolatopsis sp. 2-2]
MTTFREVFADSEFRAIFCGFGLSTAGDFLARGAVTIGVYASSQSPVLAAVTYALTFLPDLAGGALLSGLADRFSRKTVMITADLVRAGLVAVMATSGLPLAVVWLLLLAVRLLDSPFRSAQTATLSLVLTGDRYVVGTSANTMLANLAVGVGFAGAGAVAQQLGMSTALYINAGTFASSALLIWTGVRSRPVTGPGTATTGRWWGSLSASSRLVRTDRRLRTLMAFAVIPGICMVATALAAPYAVESGNGEAAAGALMGIGSAGMVVGVWAVARWLRPETRMRLLGVLAAASAAPFVVCAWQPGFIADAVIWFVNGAATCFWVPVTTGVVQSTPEAMRGQMSGLVFALLRLVQGIAILGYGLLAEVFAPSTVIAAAGSLGVVVSVVIGLAWRRVDGPVRSPAASVGQ